MPSRHRIEWSAEFPFLVFAGFLVTVFLFGGGARADILGLVIVRPMSVLVCGYALYRLDRATMRRHGVLLGLALISLLLVGLQLLPLPPAIWRSLPGRALLAQTDDIFGAGGVWRPMTMSPVDTWNSLAALATPLAALLLLLTLSVQQSRRWPIVILALGALSAMLGILQVVGPPQGPLYFYAQTNNGSAVGLFSNRNHAGVFLACLLPMLPLVASGGRRAAVRRRRHVGGVMAAMVVVPLIVVTGSRAGVLAGGVGLIAAMLLVLRAPVATGSRVTPTRSRALMLTAAAAAIALVGVAALLMRRSALNRFAASGNADDVRGEAWRQVIEVARRYQPWGSGFGSFDPVYRIHEPYAQLGPSYLNHAHNDWLELWMTGGVPAIVLLAVATVATLGAAWRVFVASRDSLEPVDTARVGAIVIAMIALASVVDYPVRTPSLAALCAVCVAALSLGATRSPAIRD